MVKKIIELLANFHANEGVIDKRVAWDIVELVKKIEDKKTCSNCLRAELVVSAYIDPRYECNKHTYYIDLEKAKTLKCKDHEAPQDEG